MSHGDLAWVEWAVADARQRARRYAAEDLSAEAHLARQEAAEVEAWEERRRGRAVRLWTAELDVRIAALDAEDARCRLAGHLRHPYHRIGDTPGLYTVDQPVALPGAPPLEEWERLEQDYPRGALAHLGDREPYGAFERAHVDDYARALVAGRERLLAAPRAAEPTARDPIPRHVGLTRWQCSQRVLFLAGPLETDARTRAGELAATIVDHVGKPLARVAGLEPDDGFPSALDGHWVHPADSVGPFAAVALWDDYDLAEHDDGDPAALAAVLGKAAEQVLDTFAREARLQAAPAPPGACTTPLERAAEQARHAAAGKSADELRRLADDADYLADRLDDTGSWENVERGEQLRRQASVYRELADGDVTARRP